MRNFKQIAFAAVAAFGLMAGGAFAATNSFSIVFSEAPSTSISCTSVANLTVPVAAGSIVATCTVLPASWTGSVGISGTGASAFVVGTPSGGVVPIEVGSVAYNTVGTVSLTATSTP
jgi:hypothetical protein